ncbi:Smr/MutS family protein [Elioraea rosea]|uniref:Smr/MutS family protein n=1 Tax=Elioraea rosea TaxID=2492390 RepID=UPI001EF56F08|nr:Smr/MutS family protein [Elioraea rosea]
MKAARPPRGRVPPARRRRTLTEDEASLWRGFVAASGIVPLRPEALPEPRMPEPEPAASPASVPAPAASPPRAAPMAELAVGIAPGGLDRKRWDQLRRGRLVPERTLDLHGRRAEEAHRAVTGFIAASWAEGRRCVAIVTGKGSGETGGVLRRELPHWLNAPGLRGMILALAHPHSANTGAVHVLLRRKK